MNTDQIAAEAAEDVYNFMQAGGVQRSVQVSSLEGIIQTAIEKATEDLRCEVTTWKRNFDLAMEKIYALENPSRAAHASELNPPDNEEIT